MKAIHEGSNLKSLFIGGGFECKIFLSGLPFDATNELNSCVVGLECFVVSELNSLL